MEAFLRKVLWGFRRCTGISRHTGRRGSGAFRRLLQLKALAVGTLDLGGVGLMGTHPDGAQAAVIGILAVVRAVVDGAVDALVGGTLAAVVGAVLHGWFLLHENFFGFRREIVCPRQENLFGFSAF